MPSGNEPADANVFLDLIQSLRQDMENWKSQMLGTFQGLSTTQQKTTQLTPAERFVPSQSNWVAGENVIHPNVQTHPQYQQLYPPLSLN